ncbi:DNA-directed RNA polymerase subunit alpha [Candidatus Daviesbacteria bacterium]|nr:DNA-directed RNA polymerase subunit alpha [Candidatus Daviesbacteria bacterium]
MFKIKPELEKDNYTKFVIEPLEQGFGNTLGNGLRRVLLSSLEGSAITSVKIDGVAHQFSTIEGVSEDVIEIILNIKKVRVNVHSDSPIKLSLKVSGKKAVQAKDIEVLGDGEIANPEQHIANVNDAKAKLNIEMTAEKGKGYSVADERKNGEIGVIAIDALFSPVVAVNYSIEPTRVGRSTNYDKLTLEVTTDGTISSLDAVNQAARILSDTFREVYEPDTEEVVAEDQGTKISGETLELTIEELDLPVRITNALKAIEINTIGDLINMPRAQLLKAKNLGSKSLSLISEKLSERGLSLGEA